MVPEECRPGLEEVVSVEAQEGHLRWVGLVEVEAKLFGQFEPRARLYAPRSIPVLGTGRLPGSSVWSHKTLTHYVARS